MKKIILLFIMSGFILTGCPEQPPKQPGPAQCTAITEDNPNAPDHCSKSKVDCEKTLSKILYDAHKNRCPTPPCTGFSASVTCIPLNQDCVLGDQSFGLLFSTSEQIRCR